MRWLRYSAIAIILSGVFMLGRLSVKPEIKIVAEALVIKKVYNLTDCPSLEDMQIYANFHDKVLIDVEAFDRQKDELEVNRKKNTAEINKIYDNRKDEAEKIIHRSYQEGYQQGFRDGRRK